MVFKTRVGFTFYALLIFQIIMTIAFIILVIFMGSVSSTWIVAVITTLSAGVFFFYFLLAIADTRYTVADEHLIIKTGWYELIIPYADIINVSGGVRSILMQPALSFIRLEIKYKTPHGMTDIVHISPVDENEFLVQLKNKVEKLSLY